MIRIERIYKGSQSDGFRILVDRLWPRGLTREKAGVDLWLKDVGPSNDLRRWFGHDPERWVEFRRQYFQELDAKKDLVDQIILRAREGDLVFLFGAKDEEHNNAVALKEYIDTMMKKGI